MVAKLLGSTVALIGRSVSRLFRPAPAESEPAPRTVSEPVPETPPPAATSTAKDADQAGLARNLEPPDYMEDLAVLDASVDTLSLPGVEDLPIVEPTRPQSTRKTRQLQTALRDRERTIQELSMRFESCVGQKPDSLQVIRGIGPHYEQLLRKGGIVTIADLAHLDAGDIQRLQEEIPGVRQRLGIWASKARKLICG